jgi:hypothetical protein
MNGRVEDSLIGRLMSADPNIPDPTNPQSYNRYSYTNNNPVTYSDPTGFDPDGGDYDPGDIGGNGSDYDPNFTFVVQPTNSSGMAQVIVNGQFDPCDWIDCSNADNWAPGLLNALAGGDSDGGDALQTVYVNASRPSKKAVPPQTPLQQVTTALCSNQGRAWIPGAVGGAVTTAIYSGGNPLAIVAGAIGGGVIGYAASTLANSPNVGPVVQGLAGGIDASPGAGVASAFVTAGLQSGGVSPVRASTLGGIAYGILTNAGPPARILGGIKGGFAGWAGGMAAMIVAGALASACGP